MHTLSLATVSVCSECIGRKSSEERTEKEVCVCVFSGEKRKMSATTAGTLGYKGLRGHVNHKSSKILSMNFGTRSLGTTTRTVVKMSSVTGGQRQGQHVSRGGVDVRLRMVAGSSTSTALAATSSDRDLKGDFELSSSSSLRGVQAQQLQKENSNGNASSVAPDALLPCDRLHATLLFHMGTLFPARWAGPSRLRRTVR